MEKKKFDVQDVITRLKQPHILLLMATLLYQGLEKLGYGIDQATFEMAVDGLTYVLLGVTVYKSNTNKLI